MTETRLNCRYFLATSGVKLPLKLVSEIEPDALTNRNTYIRAHYDAGAPCGGSRNWSMAMSS